MNRSPVPYACFVILLLAGCGKLFQPSGDPDVESGMLLMQEEKFEEAIPHLQRGIGKPLHLCSKCEVLLLLGNCHSELDQYERALTYYDGALVENPRSHRAFVGKGIVYRLTGEYDKAEEAYSRALELDPDYPETHASLGSLAVHQQKYDEAIKHLEHAVELDDSLAIAHSNLAIAYAAAGRFDDADKEIEKATARGYRRSDKIIEMINAFRERHSTTDD